MLSYALCQIVSMRHFTITVGSNVNSINKTAILIPKPNNISYETFEKLV